MPLNALRNMASAADETGPLAPARRAAAAREAAERHYRDLMPQRQKAGYDKALSKAQEFVRIRETTKATCIIGNGAGRLTMLEQGRRWMAKGWLEKADDVFSSCLTPSSKKPSRVESWTDPPRRNPSDGVDGSGRMSRATFCLSLLANYIEPDDNVVEVGAARAGPPYRWH